MIAIVKQFGVPATFAVAGMKASELAGFTKAWQQIGAAIFGAGVGLFIASKV